MRVDTKAFLPKQHGKNLSSEEWPPRTAKGISLRGKEIMWKFGPHKSIKRRTLIARQQKGNRIRKWAKDWNRHFFKEGRGYPRDP